MKVLIVLASLLIGGVAGANTGYFNCYKDCSFIKYAGNGSIPVKSFDLTASIGPNVLALRAVAGNTSVVFNFRRHGNFLYSDNGYRIGTVTANGSFKVDFGTALQCAMTVSTDPNATERLATVDCKDNVSTLFKGELVLVDRAP